MKKAFSITLALTLSATLLTSCIFNQKHVAPPTTETTAQNTTHDTIIQDTEVIETEYRYDEAYPNNDAAPASDFEYETDPQYGGIKITKYIGTDDTVIIPQTIDGLFVTTIGYGAFYQNEQVKKVTMPDCVKHINAISFASMPNLCEVNFSKNLIAIGMLSFSGSKSLQKVDLSFTSVKYIYREAFSETGIQEIKFGDQVELIAEYSFRYCESLKEIILPKNLKQLGDEAFSDCYAAKKIFIPKSLTDWGLYPFVRNTSVTEIVFEDGVSEIYPYSFYSHGSAVESIVIPASVTSIGEAAFYTYTSKLKAIYFEGDAPKHIGSGALGKESEVTVYYDPSTSGWDTVPIKDEYHIEPWIR